MNPRSTNTSALSRGRAPTHAERWLVGLLAAASLVLIATLAAALLITLPARAPTTSPEGASLQVAWLVRTGLPVYTDWQTGPAYLAIYGPLFYGLVGWIGRMVHADRDGLILVGRLLALLGFAIAVATLLLLIRRLAGNTRIALAALIPIGWMPIPAANFLVSTRPDGLALAFSLAGLLLGLRRRVPIVLTVACLTAAFQFKPTAVAAPLVLLITLLATRDYRRAAGLAGGLVVLNGLVVATLQWATDGHFLQHLLAARLAPQSWRYPGALFSAHVEVRLAVAALVLGVMLLVWHHRHRCLTDLPRADLLAIALYPPVAFVLATVLARRQGSDVNYLIEPLAALTLLTALILHAARGARSTSLRRLNIIAGVLLLLSAVAVWPPRRIVAARDFAAFGEVLDAAQRQRASRLQALPQPVLSLESWLAHVSGIDGYLSDRIAYTSLALVRPDLDSVARRVEEGYFQTIITYEPIEQGERPIYQDIPYAWPRLRTAIQTRYEEGDSPRPWYFYRPRSSRP